MHRTRAGVRALGRLRLEATRAPAPAATPAAASAPTTFTALRPLAVFGAAAIPSAACAPPTTTAATTALPPLGVLAVFWYRSTGRRGGGRRRRGPRRQHIAAGPEVGIDFDDTDLRDLRGSAAATGTGATARAAPESCAAHPHSTA